MANIVSLDDINKGIDDQNKDKRVTSSFAGGEKSALAVENPVDNLCAKAERSSGPLGPNTRRITLYSNGFIVDGGDFREGSAPENQAFIKQLLTGYAPKELQEGATGQVDVALTDKRGEKYEAAIPPRYAIFAGEGAQTGAEVRSVPAGTVDPARGAVSVNRERPTTALSVRFHNGQNTRVEFNQDHTISDLHRFIEECAPVTGGYSLLSGYPPKEIEKPSSTTLKDAGLCDEVVVMKLR